MNLLWNKNFSLFKKRFPALEKALSSFETDFLNGEQNIFFTEKAKDGSLTARENSLLLHSKYNPVKEAEQLISSFNPDKYQSAVFYSFGLGYAPNLFAKKFPDTKIILLEADPHYLFAAFCLYDWQNILEHNNLILLTGASTLEVAAIISKNEENAIYSFNVKSQSEHAKNYYDEVKKQLKKQKQKKEINENTLEKFAKLWLKNSCRNLSKLYKLPGINCLKNQTNLPFTILAAGPSLSKILPHLNEIKKRSILICVESALHACLKANVEPDFIILMDPQYVCFQHIEFLSSPSSSLITEPGVYPSVFSFKCKNILLSSSLYPVAQYFEKTLGSKGKIEAGGSVTTSAWDFAKFCGAKEIYLAGMDLGFPNRLTHIRGSQFEEKIHSISNRKKTAEEANCSTLLNAGLTQSKDFNGKNILTDKRMSLFSWWFENACDNAQKEGINTYTLTGESLFIKNIKKSSVEEILCKKNIEEEKNIFIKKAKSLSDKEIAEGKTKFENALIQFTDELLFFEQIAKSAILLCEDAINDIKTLKHTLAELSILDNKIINAGAKNVVSLIFPTQRQLDKKSKDIPKEEPYHTLFQSKLFYCELLNSVEEYKKVFAQIQKFL